MAAQLTPVQLAGMLPRDERFREFVSQYMVPPRMPSVDEAAHFIRVACEVESRREIAQSARAAAAFHRFICRPFSAWQEKQTHVEV